MTRHRHTFVAIFYMQRLLTCDSHRVCISGSSYYSTCGVRLL